MRKRRGGYKRELERYTYVDLAFMAINVIKERNRKQKKRNGKMAVL